MLSDSLKVFPVNTVYLRPDTGLLGTVERPSLFRGKQKTRKRNKKKKKKEKKKSIIQCPAINEKKKVHHANLQNEWFGLFCSLQGTDVKEFQNSNRGKDILKKRNKSFSNGPSFMDFYMQLVRRT